jgi:hypothetical protein
MATIALVAPMARSTNRSTTEAPISLSQLLCVTKLRCPAYVRVSELGGHGADGSTNRSRIYP